MEILDECGVPLLDTGSAIRRGQASSASVLDIKQIIMLFLLCSALDAVKSSVWSLNCV